MPIPTKFFPSFSVVEETRVSMAFEGGQLRVLYRTKASTTTQTRKRKHIFYFPAYDYETWLEDLTCMFAWLARGTASYAHH